MASLQGWSYPVPLLFICQTTLAINARYLLMGATLRPWFAGRPAIQAYTSLFFLGDGNWILAMSRRDEAIDGAAFLFGSGLAMWIAWVSSTIAGPAFGRILGDPRAFGVDFMLAAFFATAAVTFWGRAKDVSPLLVAGIVAVAVEKTLPGPWYILLGALAGSLVGAFRHGRTT